MAVQPLSANVIGAIQGLLASCYSECAQVVPCRYDFRHYFIRIGLFAEDAAAEVEVVVGVSCSDDGLYREISPWIIHAGLQLEVLYECRDPACVLVLAENLGQ